MTGPTKRDQVGTKYTISQNGKYFEFCVQYVVSINCKMLPFQKKLCIDGKRFTSIAVGEIISYDATKSKNVVKFCVPTWSIFAGPVTFYTVSHK